MQHCHKYISSCHPCFLESQFFFQWIGSNKIIDIAVADKTENPDFEITGAHKSTEDYKNPVFVYLQC